MSETITLSLNELRALLRKAFEGVFAHSRDWNAMADTVLRLESHGYDGMSVFFDAYPQMHADNFPALSISSNGAIEIAAHDISLMEYVHLLGDVLLARAKKTGTAEAIIADVNHPKVFKILIDRCGAQGFDVGITVKENDTIVNLQSTDASFIVDTQTYNQTLDTGVTLNYSNYIKLCEYADRVLVPATEQSRRGAGE